VSDDKEVEYLSDETLDAILDAAEQADEAIEALVGLDEARRDTNKFLAFAMRNRLRLFAMIDASHRLVGVVEDAFNEEEGEDDDEG
jgi:hypothetical protein